MPTTATTVYRAFNGICRGEVDEVADCSVEC
jgi:hypothetical protein